MPCRHVGAAVIIGYVVCACVTGCDSHFVIGFILDMRSTEKSDGALTALSLM